MTIRTKVIITRRLALKVETQAGAYNRASVNMFHEQTNHLSDNPGRTTMCLRDVHSVTA